MKPNSSQRLLLVLAVVALLFFGCEQNTDQQTDFVPEEETIAVINNKKIPLVKFQERLTAFLQRYRDLTTTDEKQLGEIKNIVINQLIDEELIAQEAARKGIQVHDDELEANLAESLSSYERTNFDTYLRASNLSETEWKERLRQYLVQRKLVKEEVNDKIPITKREIRSYYQTHKNEFVVPQALKVRNITLSTEEEAQAIRSQLLRGRNFKNLIRQHSISPDKLLDGDLGYVSRGDMPVEMETAIFYKKFKRFKPSYTEVVRAQDGFHVFYIERYRSRKRLSQNDAKAQIKQLLIEQKWDAHYNQWLEKLRKNATISIDEAMLQREEGF